MAALRYQSAHLGTVVAEGQHLASQQLQASFPGVAIVRSVVGDDHEAPKAAASRLKFLNAPCDRRRRTDEPKMLGEVVKIDSLIRHGGINFQQLSEPQLQVERQ